MAFYSIPRMTRDIDLVVSLQVSDADKIERLFSDDCYIDSACVVRAIKNYGVFNIIQNETSLRQIS